jgi:hypothetical protein
MPGMGFSLQMGLQTSKRVNGKYFAITTCSYLKTQYRYFNTDFALLSALQHVTGEVLFISYDIACQWTVNFDTRCEDFPPDLRDAIKNRQIRYAIPKFHLPAHGFRCWSLFSLNYIIGSGRVDGEGIERLWSVSNPVATSTREMGHGSRHDFLEDRWGAANFRKLIGLGTSLARKLKSDVHGKTRHLKEMEEFSAAFEPAIISKWKENVLAYHNDPSEHDDPYHVLTPGVSICGSIVRCSFTDLYHRIHHGRYSKGVTGGRTNILRRRGSTFVRRDRFSRCWHRD